MLGVLVGLHGARTFVHGQLKIREFKHPISVFDAFSTVAALTVTAVALSPEFTGWALAVIWGCALVLWLSVVATVLKVIVRHRSRGVLHFVSGRWLLAVVSIESIAVLGAAASAVTQSATISVSALIAWLAGLVIYPAIAVMIATRLHGRGWHAMDVTPDHWILVGGLAICTLAATGLAASHTVVVVRGLHPYLAAAAWVTWIGAGALYALMAGVTLRRVIVWRAARQPDLRWWAAVFPLGMYSACTFGLFDVSHVDALRVLAGATFWPALAAWAVASLMSTRVIVRSLQRVHT